MHKLISFLGVFLLLQAPYLQSQSLTSRQLEIYPIEENVWVHVTYLETEEWGRVACNGMIYESEDEVVIFDTPITDEVSKLLINWVETKLNAAIKAVVVNHHHIDCLGGLAAFHEAGITSYGYPSENELASRINGIAPKLEHGAGGFDTLKIGTKQIVNFYPGPAHTHGSLVSYLPETHTIFGGCQVKAMGAGKGNLADADTTQWPISIQKIKDTFPHVKKVIPGHGNVGDIRLLDYTVELFKKK
jgi:metallo-beta-lactamase class B